MRTWAIVGSACLFLVACSGEVDSKGNPGAGSGGATGGSGTAGVGNAGATGSSATTTGSTTTSGGSAGSTGGSGTGGRPGNDGGPPKDATVVPRDALGPSGTTEFAPYFPTWTWGGNATFSSLTDLRTKSGLGHFTLAFVLSGGSCKVAGTIGGHQADIDAFVAAGGKVKASFGGASGTYVESNCADASSFAKAIGDFVDATHITDLDFDIEESAALTDAMNDLRGQGLKMAQDAKGIRVAFTLEAVAQSGGTGGGLNARGVSLVTRAVNVGVVVDHVNVMTMDYGNQFQGQPLAPVAIGTLNGLHAQLMTIVPGITSEKAWSMVGVIPMIGHNDDAEIFSLADAKTLSDFAIANKIGLVSFWSIDRDRTCSSGCSGVNAADFDFSHAFAAVTP
jgi:chitinase